MFRNKRKKAQFGYTLIEMLITIFVLGLLLLMVNVVLISLVRLSYRAEAHNRVRQSVEFAFEYMNRNLKSADPDILQSGQIRCTKTDPEHMCDAILASISGGDSAKTVAFFLFDPGGGQSKIVRAAWDYLDPNLRHDINLTTGQDVSVKEFTEVINRDDEKGVVTVAITLKADSVNKLNNIPVVKDFFKQSEITLKYRESAL